MISLNTSTSDTHTKKISNRKKRIAKSQKCIAKLKHFRACGEHLARFARDKIEIHF